MGGICENGRCQPFVFADVRVAAGDSSYVESLAIDAENVYAGLLVASAERNPQNGESCRGRPLVLGISRESLAATPLVDCDQFWGGSQQTRGIAVVGSDLFWSPAFQSVDGSDSGIEGRLHLENLANRGVTDLGAALYGGTILADGDGVIYYDFGGAEGVLRRYTRAAGVQDLLQDGGPVHAVAADAARVFCLVDSTCMNKSCQGNGKIFSVPRGGGAPTSVAKHLYVKDNLLWQAAGHLYFNVTNASGGEGDGPRALVRLSTHGGSMATFAEGAHAERMVFDDRYAYWLGSDRGGKTGLFRQELDSADPELLSVENDDGSQRFGLAQDDRLIVWAFGGSEIKALAK